MVSVARSIIAKGLLWLLGGCGSTEGPYRNPSPLYDCVCSKSRGDHDESWSKRHNGNEGREENGLIGKPQRSRNWLAAKHQEVKNYRLASWKACNWKETLATPSLTEVWVAEERDCSIWGKGDGHHSCCIEGRYCRGLRGSDARCDHCVEGSLLLRARRQRCLLRSLHRGITAIES